jgi:hypothetical protein
LKQIIRSEYRLKPDEGAVFGVKSLLVQRAPEPAAIVGDATIDDDAAALSPLVLAIIIGGSLCFCILIAVVVGEHIHSPYNTCAKTLCVVWLVRRSSNDPQPLTTPADPSDLYQPISTIPQAPSEAQVGIYTSPRATYDNLEPMHVGQYDSIQSSPFPSQGYSDNNSNTGDLYQNLQLINDPHQNAW